MVTSMQPSGNMHATDDSTETTSSQHSVKINKIKHSTFFFFFFFFIFFTLLLFETDSNRLITNRRFKVGYSIYYIAQHFLNVDLTSVSHYYSSYEQSPELCEEGGGAGLLRSELDMQSFASGCSQRLFLYRCLCSPH